MLTMFTSQRGCRQSWCHRHFCSAVKHPDHHSFHLHRFWHPSKVLEASNRHLRGRNDPKDCTCRSDKSTCVSGCPRLQMHHGSESARFSKGDDNRGVIIKYLVQPREIWTHGTNSYANFPSIMFRLHAIRHGNFNDPVIINSTCFPPSSPRYCTRPNLKHTGNQIHLRYHGCVAATARA